MAKICENCGKGRQKVHSWKKIMSKLDPTKTYYQKPNLHAVVLKDGKKSSVCTKCKRKMTTASKIK